MKYFIFVNFAIYQATWFLAALYPDSASLLITGLIIIHFILSPTKIADFRLLNIAVIGCVVDGVLILYDVIQTTNGTLPTTLILLWCVFSFTFNHCLNWLQTIGPKYVCLIGLVLGPSSYFAALKLNTFDTTLSSIEFIAIYAFIWALLLPLFVKYTTSVKILFEQNAKEAEQ